MVIAELEMDETGAIVMFKNIATRAQSEPKRKLRNLLVFVLELLNFRRLFTSFASPDDYECTFPHNHKFTCMGLGKISPI